DLHDGRVKLQLFVRLQNLDDASGQVLDNLDLGDQIGASGTLMRTRAGELSLMTDRLTLLAKALRPLPEKWHGLTDVEVRYRQRYLDLASNEESRLVFEVRAAVVKGIREFLDAHDFLEVETPMMHLMPGGATARPFKTHHNALDLELFLRIAPELFLKRLLVGGIPRVYEINRNFRNEGISTRHNPEFTMLELYWAYADYRDMMDLTEEMLTALAEVAKTLQGKEHITWQGEPVDLARPWDRLTMREAVSRYAEIPVERLDTLESLREVIAEKGLEMPPGGSYGHLLMALFEETAEKHLVRPTFITDHPVEISPLSKQRP
ncbi:MAG: amino acid--tRNA ligase-related protein, partial [Acidobacteriota bacterium]